MLRNQDSSMFLLFAIFSFFSRCKIDLNLGMVKLTKLLKDIYRHQHYELLKYRESVKNNPQASGELFFRAM